MKYSILTKFVFIIYLMHFTKSLLSTYEIKEPSQQFRGVWSGVVAGDRDLIAYDTEENFTNKMTYILDTLKMYNIDALIFHVRTENNAFYKSKINPINFNFRKVNFDEFDPLKWLMEEAHRRGIDFHAWFNL